MSLWVAPAREEMDRPLSGQEGFLLSRLSERGIAHGQIASAKMVHHRLEDRQPLSRTLVELGLALDSEMAQWIAEFNHWSYLAPERLQVRDQAHSALPEAISRNRHALVIARAGSNATLAIADPLTPQFAQVQHAMEGCRIEWVVSPQADIDARISECFCARAEIAENEAERFVEDMLREAAHARGVSDIHVVPDDRSFEIKWRVDGDLVTWRVISSEMKEAVAAQVKLSSTRGSDGRSKHEIASGGLDVANRLDPQDASTLRTYGSKRLSLRYSVIPAVTGESIVIRLLDQGAQVDSLESLGMLADGAMRFRSELRNPGGLVIVAGPTGHGKSTTLAASVPWLSAHTRRVLSVEDPVEYRLRNVTQVQVSPRMGFASALRAFLRHNPDVIIIGEIRDSETAALAVRLALTGHLVLTTLHATTATRALSRLLDLGSDPSLLAATVRFQLSQRLVKRLCKGCRRPHPRSLALSQRYPHVSAALNGASGPHGFYEAGGGCDHCGQTGFCGRLGIFEFRDVRAGVTDLLTGRDFDAAAAELIFSRAMAGGDLGSRNLREDGLIKAALGLTTPEEVLAATLE